MSRAQVEREVLAERFEWGAAPSGYCLASPVLALGQHRWGDHHSTGPIWRLPIRGHRQAAAVKEWPPWLVPTRSGEKGCSYSPLVKQPHLYREFAEVPLSADGILRFAKQYGLLGCDSVLLFDPAPKGGHSPLVGESLFAWWAEIQTMRMAVKVTDALQAAKESGSTEGLEEFLVWHRGSLWYQATDGESARLTEAIACLDDPKPRAHLEADFFLQPKARPIAFPRLGDPDAEWKRTRNLMGPAERFVLFLINGNIRGRVSPQLELARSPRRDTVVRTELSPDSLLGALWLQLYLDFSGKRLIRECLVCAKGFDALQHPRSLYCRTNGDGCRKKADRIRGDIRKGLPAPEAAEKHGIAVDRLDILLKRSEERARRH